MVFKSHIKMEVLCELRNGSLSGYDLIKRIGTINNKKPSAGYIYPLLQDLLNKGFLTVKTTKRRKVYMITKRGEKFFDDLRKNSENSMKNLVDILEPVVEKDEIGKYIEFHEKLKKLKGYLVKDIPLYTELVDSLTEIYEQKDKIKQKKIKKIVTESIDKLKKI
jgi:DNA-binding PadR family transcriptional regulator